MTRQTARSQMFALRAIVAAEGQHPAPSSHEQASASEEDKALVAGGRELAHTQFITAMLIAPTPPAG
jgi:hypothetical protein